MHVSRGNQRITSDDLNCYQQSSYLGPQFSQKLCHMLVAVVPVSGKSLIPGFVRYQRNRARLFQGSGKLGSHPHDSSAQIKVLSDSVVGRWPAEAFPAGDDRPTFLPFSPPTASVWTFSAVSQHSCSGLPVNAQDIWRLSLRAPFSPRALRTHDSIRYHEDRVIKVGNRLKSLVPIPKRVEPCARR
jgi:hypothetical protein